MFKLSSKLVTLYPPPVRHNTHRGSPELHLHESHPQLSDHVLQEKVSKLLSHPSAGGTQGVLPKIKGNFLPIRVFVDGWNSHPLPAASHFLADPAASAASSYTCPQPSTFPSLKYHSWQYSQARPQAANLAATQTLLSLMCCKGHASLHRVQQHEHENTNPVSVTKLSSLMGISINQESS